MNISFTGSRDLTLTQSLAIFSDAKDMLCSRLKEDDKLTVFVGGAKGVDMMCLSAAIAVREIVDSTLSVIVVLPDNIGAVTDPDLLYRIYQADQIWQLRNEITKKNGWKSYRERNKMLVDQADHVEAFQHLGKTTGGTEMTIKIAMESNKSYSITYIHEDSFYEN